MSHLDQQPFRDLVNLLILHCGDPARCKSLATTALFGCKVLDKIEYSGSPQDYVVHLVTTLLTYGECEQGRPALIAVLDEVIPSSKKTA